MDGSGAVEWEEFCVLIYKKMREKDPDNEIKEAFRVFDAEGTGLIGECQDGTFSYLECKAKVMNKRLCRSRGAACDLPAVAGAAVGR